jgi:hypothetical protein
MFPGLLNSLADTSQDFQAGADRFIPSLLDAPQTILAKMAQWEAGSASPGLGYRAATGVTTPGTVHSIMGRRGESKEHLAKLQEATDLGMGSYPTLNRDEIARTTGVFELPGRPGMPEKMVSEIDDSASFMKSDFWDLLRDPRYSGASQKSPDVPDRNLLPKDSWDNLLTVGDAIHHPGLFEAYPHLENMGLKLSRGYQKGGYRGSYSPRGVLDTHLPNEEGKLIKQAGGTEHGPITLYPENIRLAHLYSPTTKGAGYDLDFLDKNHSTLLHELTHGVQDYEGLLGGTNLEAALDLKLRGEMADYRKLKEVDSRLGHPEFTGKLAEYKQKRDEAIPFYAADHIKSLDKLITGSGVKPRALKGRGDWYEYSGDVHRELGPMPKRPGVNRDDYIRRAAKILKAKNLERYKASMQPEEFESFLTVLRNNSPKDIKNAVKRHEYFMDTRKSVRNEWQGLENERRDVKEHQRRIRDLAPSDIYRAESGERVARAVQHRMNMPAEDRLSTPFLSAPSMEGHHIKNMAQPHYLEGLLGP